MIDFGDIHLADLNEEGRRLVLVVSTSRFHQLSGRALVAPQAMGPKREVPPPWRIQVDGIEFAFDTMRTVWLDRLLERVDRTPASATRAVRRAVRSITEG